MTKDFIYCYCYMSFKVYEAIYSDVERQGVYGISLVENPAMEDEWIALSEQEAELQFAAVDENKRLLLGAVLIPNKKIYRNVGGNEFYITFTEDTIGNLAHDFIKKGFQNNSSAEHEVELSDVSFVESWQVENPDIDKSALYGKKYEKGTWVTMAKVSDELYEQATNGTFKGFSIDALLGLEEINFNKTEMTKTDLKTFGDKLLEEIKATFTSSEEVKETEVKEEVVETQSETTEEVVEDVVDAPEFNAEAFIDSLKETLVEFKADVTKQIEDLKVELTKETEEKETKIEELETELNKQPEVEAIVAKPETKTDQVETKKPKSIKDRVLANLAALN